MLDALCILFQLILKNCESVFFPFLINHGWNWDSEELGDFPQITNPFIAGAKIWAITLPPKSDSWARNWLSFSPVSMCWGAKNQTSLPDMCGWDLTGLREELGLSIPSLLFFPPFLPNYPLI